MCRLLHARALTAGRAILSLPDCWRNVVLQNQNRRFQLPAVHTCTGQPRPRMHLQIDTGCVARITHLLNSDAYLECRTGTSETRVSPPLSNPMNAPPLSSIDRSTVHLSALAPSQTLQKDSLMQQWLQAQAPVTRGQAPGCCCREPETVITPSLLRTLIHQIHRRRQPAPARQLPDYSHD